MIHQPTLTPEESLFLLSARIDLTAEESFRIHKILKQNPDWSIVYKQAITLGILALLFKHLSQNGNKNYVPDEIMATFEKGYISQLCRNFKLYNELSQILKVMNKADIPIILLKGVYLANYIYEDIALRPMGDIDILVREEDKEFVQEKLREIGFEKPDYFYPSDLHENNLGDKTRHLTPMIKSKNWPVEVHFNVFAGFPYNTVDMEKVWETAESTTINGCKAMCLSPEYQLLHLCLHLYNHIVPAKGQRLTFYWLCDIHELIRHFKNKMDWDKFCDVAYSLKVNAQVSSLLVYMKHNWNTPIPETVLLFCSEKGINTPCFTTIIRSLLDGSKFKRSHVHRYIRKSKDLLSKNEGRSYFYCLWKEIVPNRSHLIVRYNIKDSPYVYLYYIIHPFKLLARIVSSIFYNVMHLTKEKF